MALHVHVGVPMKLKTLPSVVALGLMTAFSTVGFAQQPPAQPGQTPQQQGERQRTDDSTMTGCLGKGAASGQYVLTDKAGAKTNVTAAAGVELEKHAANHTVKLTGSKGSDGSFAASKVEHVSATCEAR
jgi:hypothetical protein